MKRLALQGEKNRFEDVLQGILVVAKDSTMGLAQMVKGAATMGFPTIEDTHHKDRRVWGSILGSPIFRGDTIMYH